jgi:hypothetical protein
MYTTIPNTIPYIRSCTIVPCLEVRYAATWDCGWTSRDEFALFFFEGQRQKGVKTYESTDRVVFAINASIMEQELPGRIITIETVTTPHPDDPELCHFWERKDIQDTQYVQFLRYTLLHLFFYLGSFLFQFGGSFVFLLIVQGWDSLFHIRSNIPINMIKFYLCPCFLMIFFYSLDIL